MANRNQLEPENQFPTPAIEASVQDKSHKGEGDVQTLIFTWNMASVADEVTQWGVDVWRRDQELREFWPSESTLAGAVTNVCQRNAAFRFNIRHKSSRVEQAVNDMLLAAQGPGGQIGWRDKETAFSQDLYTTDNGAFEELIRDPGMDATSRFKGPAAPVIGIAHLDSGQCLRTGDPEFPVVYTDRHGARHKLAYYEVIPYAEMPSPIARMNGVQYCSVTRVLRMAQIMKSVFVLTNEMLTGRNHKKIHVVGGVSRTDIDDVKKRGQEEADNAGYQRFIEHAILASLDPEKPVSLVTINLAEFPEGFNFDIFMKWYISTLALGFAVDYQEFAPLPGGNIGSSAQSEILNQKTRAKGPATYQQAHMDKYKIYGVLPRDAEMEYEDQNQAEELEKQEVRTKAMEEYALALHNGVLSPDASRADLVRRGIYDKETISGIPEGFGLDLSNTTIRDTISNPPTANGEITGNPNPAPTQGKIGKNTMAQDAARTPFGKQSQTIGDRLRKALGGK